MLNTIKIRIYPNRTQQQLIHQTFGSSRLVYNMILDARIKAYECGDNLSAYDLKKRLPKMRKAADFLKAVDSTALQNSVLKIGEAYKKFFNKQGGFPKFKSKHNPRQSYQRSTASIKQNKLKLPKICELKTKFHRNIPITKIKPVTISCEADQYFTSINYGEKDIAKAIKAKKNWPKQT